MSISGSGSVPDRTASTQPWLLLPPPEIPRYSQACAEQEQGSGFGGGLHAPRARTALVECGLGIEGIAEKGTTGGRRSWTTEDVRPVAPHPDEPIH